MMKKRHPHLLFVTLVFLAGLIFTTWPILDISVSSFFYDSHGNFPSNNEGWVMAIYHGVPWLGRSLFFMAVGVLVIAVAKPALVSRRTWRRSAAFVTLVVLGIGILVHTVLKDGMGRPRPRDVIEFAGSTAFVPVFVPSQFCKTNCSFVSGHAAVGFALMAFGMLGTKRRRSFWLAIGLLSGSLIGLVRIAQGGHFLSDIVFSFFAVWLTHLCVREIWLRFRFWQLNRLTVPLRRIKPIA